MVHKFVFVMFGVAVALRLMNFHKIWYILTLIHHCTLCTNGNTKNMKLRLIYMMLNCKYNILFLLGVIFYVYVFTCVIYVYIYVRMYVFPYNSV